MDTSEGRTTLQEDLDRLEEWDNQSLMKFNKYKCCTWKNITQEFSTIWDLHVEMDLWVLVNKILNMSEQCAVAAKTAHGLLTCINKDITSR
ncbi:rna-directed dna polymerase from mobile element jockey-like [Willisornis vidua]|uniref:Rna-directed dna polymerase from mobile element jockey-like n=1 Tax=Willisornis vidua TaxID=1566151 RepID=A0ABQ9CXF4_9PASS|nr:rna-directed dna polymerase from mobile element jockey-like [Willisornis vidua]